MGRCGGGRVGKTQGAEGAMRFGQNGTWKVKNEKEEPIDGIDERVGHMKQRIEQLVEGP